MKFDSSWRHPPITKCFLGNYAACFQSQYEVLFFFSPSKLSFSVREKSKKSNWMQVFTASPRLLLYTGPGATYVRRCVWSWLYHVVIVFRSGVAIYLGNQSPHPCLLSRWTVRVSRSRNGSLIAAFTSRFRPEREGHSLRSELSFGERFASSVIRSEPSSLTSPFVRFSKTLRPSLVKEFFSLSCSLLDPSAERILLPKKFLRRCPFSRERNASGFPGPHCLMERTFFGGK